MINCLPEHSKFCKTTESASKTIKLWEKMGFRIKVESVKELKKVAGKDFGGDAKWLIHGWE